MGTVILAVLGARRRTQWNTSQYGSRRFTRYEIYFFLTLHHTPSTPHTAALFSSSKLLKVSTWYNLHHPLPGTHLEQSGQAMSDDRKATRNPFITGGGDEYTEDRPEMR